MFARAVPIACSRVVGVHHLHTSYGQRNTMPRTGIFIAAWLLVCLQACARGEHAFCQGGASWHLAAQLYFLLLNCSNGVKQAPATNLFAPWLPPCRNAFYDRGSTRTLKRFLPQPKIVEISMLFRKMTFLYTWAMGLFIGVQFDFR